MSRRRALAGGLCALVLAAALLGCGGSESAAGDSPQALRDSARAAAQRFFDGYVDGDGRVVRRDQGGDSVSEGQAYALLLAAAIGDERRLDRVWGWTRANLQRSDGLLASRWAAGSVADPQPATDADLDAAHALVSAGRRMHRGDLRRAGERIGRAVLAHETVIRDGRRVLVAGPWAVDGGVVNPSYFAPRAYAVLRSAAGGPAWSSLRSSADEALRGLVAGDRLPPDWASAGVRASATPIARPGGPASEPARYGFDAVRVPIRQATACNARSRRIAARLWPRLRVGDPAQLPRELDSTPAPDAVRHATALVGAAAAARAAGDGSVTRSLLDRAEQLDHDAPTYYGSAWVALGRVLLTTKLLADCPGR
jgi:endoglucanase